MEEQHSPPSTHEPPAERSTATLRALHERARQTLAAQRERMGNLEQQLVRQLETVTEAVAEQLNSDSAETAQTEQQLAEAAEMRRQLEEAQRQSQAEREALEGEIAQRQQQLDTRTAELENREKALADREQQATDHHQQQLQEELQAAQLERDELAGRLAELETAYRTLEANLHEREADWNAEQAKLAAQRDEANHALDEARQQLEAAGANDGAAAERDELKQKFDLALEDVQQLRQRCAELEQQLAHRPAPSDTESAEVVHLRAERDAMSERIATLEREASENLDSATAEEMNHLQRRFELAVEDLRELKTEKAKLEAQLAAAAPVADLQVADGLDWESQKRKLLASLGAEGGDGGPQRQQERASIEDTIRITDDVVAQKDREIAQLQSQLASAPSQSDQERASDQDAQVAAIVDADEIIQQHRARLEQLEGELQDKLRAAELELSVERARIAREHAELAEWRIELETLRESLAFDSDVSRGDNVRKRRWLDKLGLGGDDA